MYEIKPEETCITTTWTVNVIKDHKQLDIELINPLTPSKPFGPYDHAFLLQ